MPFSLLRTCGACGARNRVPAGRLADEGRCGACKAALPPASEPIDVDTESFSAIVAESPVPILVDFWASWCGPCKMAAPEIHKLAADVAGKALVIKVNTEQYPDLGARYGVQAIPNFVVLRGGRVVSQRAGLAPRSEMRRWLEAV